MNQTASVELVSACGLYCGTCRKYLKGSCPGCRENHKAAWCKIRLCVREKGYDTCAQCTAFPDVNQCSKFNTLVAKLFSLVFRSDRKASLAFIAESGTEAYAAQMQETGMVVFKRK